MFYAKYTDKKLILILTGWWAINTGRAACANRWCLGNVISAYAKVTTKINKQFIRWRVWSALTWFMSTLALGRVQCEWQANDFVIELGDRWMSASGTWFSPATEEQWHRKKTISIQFLAWMQAHHHKTSNLSHKPWQKLPPRWRRLRRTKSQQRWNF